MSSAPLPFRFRRRRFSAAMPLHGLGQPGQPPIGPSVLAPFYPDSNSDPVEAVTEMDEGTYQAPQAGSNRPDLPPWIYQPTNWENVDQINYALLPAIGSTVTIVTYVVPPGRNGIINKVACNFVGGGWIEGSADVVWRILVDGTPPPGATSYDNIIASLGSPASPTGIAGFRFFENQVVTVVAFNNPGGASGGVVVSGQRVGARLVGWNYPTDIEESDIWI
jgi:hypothetical protein